MRASLPRAAGVALLLTLLAVAIGHLLGDPTVENQDTRADLVAEVEDAADMAPVIYAFQAVEIATALVVVLAALAIYAMLRERARLGGLAAAALFVLSGIFHAGTGIVGAGMIRAADDYVGAGPDGLGRGSDEVLELIRVLSVMHFANFLAGFALLGFGVGIAAYGLAWPARATPRWLGWLGVVAAALLVLTPLAVTAEVLFLPFFVGALLTLVWLLIAGAWLIARPERAAAS
jgi:hypothetical protein